MTKRKLVRTPLTEVIILRREELELTQAAVALRVGVARAVYARIERNAETVHLATLRKIAKALDVTPHQLLFWAHKHSMHHAG